MILKEPNMQTRKYQKSYWIKLILLFVTTLFLTSCIYNNTKYKKIVSDTTNQSIFLAMDVKYQDSIYRIVLRNGELYSILQNKLSEKIYKNRILEILEKKHILEVDSIEFTKLKNYTIAPQQCIDSIYRKGVTELISSFFNENGALTSPISDVEEKYIINLLFLNYIFSNIDCETGTLYIENI